MEDIYVNISALKPVQPAPEKQRPGSRGSERSPSRYLPLCLGLLILALLAGLVAVSVLLYLSKAELFALRANLTQPLLDPLDAGPAPGAEAPERLQDTCPAGWTVFNSSCYFFSHEAQSWVASWQSCRRAGADLVVIDTPEEQNFLVKNLMGNMWIGLTDIESEGTWKWIDGSPLINGTWCSGQPDNWIESPEHGDEDCAHLRYNPRESDNGKLNDVRCNSPFHWVCKKKLG